MSLCSFGTTKNGCRKDYSNKPCNGTRNAPYYLCNPKTINMPHKFTNPKTIKTPHKFTNYRRSRRLHPCNGTRNAPTSKCNPNPTQDTRIIKHRINPLATEFLSQSHVEYGQNYLKTEFPKKMAIIITAHGTLQNPMRAPMKASRFISNDFGTCNFNTQSDRNKIHNFAKNGNLAEVKKLIYIRDKNPNIHHLDLDDYTKFKNGIHYKKNNKTFIKGSKMLDKLLSYKRTKNKQENDRSIIIRDAINPLSPYRDLVNRNIKKEQLWTLSKLMEMFYKGGCTELTIYDFSCSPYDGDVKNYKYGGS